MKLYTLGVRSLLSGNILVLLVVLMVYMFLPIFQFLELKSIDTRFQVRNALGMNPNYSNALVHINLDNYSKQASGINRWPLKHYGNPSEIEEPIHILIPKVEDPQQYYKCQTIKC